jgi:hypothetical protein
MRHDHPPPEELSYMEAVRRHPRVVAGLAIVTLVFGVLWLAVRSPAYEAGAEVLVSPIAAEEQAFVGIDVIHESGDATRTVQTAAALLQSPAAAADAAGVLGPQGTGGDVERMVRVEPQGESSLVVVTARAASGDTAVRVANAYASAALRVRDRVVGAQIRDRIAGLDERLSAAAHGSATASDLSDRREALAVAGDGDPSLSLAEPAAPPASATGPPGWLMLCLFTAVGIAVGAATSLALEVLERRRPSPAVDLEAPGSAAAIAPPRRRRASTADELDAAADAHVGQPGDRTAEVLPPEATDDAVLVQVLRRAIGEAGPRLTRRGFDDWRRAQAASKNGAGQSVPSASTIARRFGGWSRACAKAGGASDAAPNGAAERRQGDNAPPARPPGIGG